MPTRTTCTKKNSWEWFIPINNYKNDLYQKILRVVYTNKRLRKTCTFVGIGHSLFFFGTCLSQSFIGINHSQNFLVQVVLVVITKKNQRMAYTNKTQRVVYIYIYTNKWLQEWIVPTNDLNMYQQNTVSVLFTWHLL
jgi:hypothetical protein